MPDWTAGEDRYMAEYRGEDVDDPPTCCDVCGELLVLVGAGEWECLDCLDAFVAERDAEIIIDQAVLETEATQVAPPTEDEAEEPPLVAVNTEILVRRIAEALHRARRAA